jgi:hypothetical protein
MHKCLVQIALLLVVVLVQLYCGYLRIANTHRHVRVTIGLHQHCQAFLPPFIIEAATHEPVF